MDGSISYQTGDANRLLNDGTYTYTYDNEGNRLTRTHNATGALTEYAWDHRNRLVKVTFKTSGGVKTKEVGYTYDYLGRRIRKAIDSDGNGTVDDYFYNVHRGDELALEFRDQDGLAGQTYSPAVHHRYLYGAAVDQILAVENAAGQVRWGLADHEGTIRDVVDSAGQLVNHVEFDSFGDHVDSTAPVVDFLFGFTGRPYDPDTDLHDYRARWYDPEVGRWLSEDPAGFDAGDVNLYRYAGNSPVMYVDPSGMAFGGFGKIAGAVGNALGAAFPTTSYIAGQAWDLGSSFVSNSSGTAGYLGGMAAGAVDYAFGTNFGTPLVNYARTSQTTVTSSIGLTPFYQGAAAFQQGMSWLQSAATQATSGGGTNVSSSAWAARDAAVRNWQANALASAQASSLPPGFGSMDWATPQSRSPFGGGLAPIPLAPSLGMGLVGGTASAVVGGTGIIGGAAALEAGVGPALVAGYNELGYAAGGLYYALPPVATSPLTWGAVGAVGAYAWTGDWETSLQVGAIPLLMIPDRASGDLSRAYMGLRNPIGPSTSLGYGRAAASEATVEFQQYRNRDLFVTPGEAHHLNQTPILGGRVTYQNGVTTPLQGDAFRDVGTPHFLSHRGTEAFFDLYRPGTLPGARFPIADGPLLGTMPTYSQFNRAWYNALQSAGVPSNVALRMVIEAKAEQLGAGFRGADVLQDLPGRMGQRGGP